MTETAMMQLLAVIVGGFGPLGRDGGDGLYRRLADDLARRGVASLRYDKRGVGDSPGPPLAWLNAEVLAADAAAAARTGAALAETDPGTTQRWQPAAEHHGQAKTCLEPGNKRGE